MSYSPRVFPSFNEKNRAAQEGLKIPFSVGNTKNGPVDFAWWNGMDSSGLALDMSGFRTEDGFADFTSDQGNNPNYTLTINWSLYAGGMCALDDEPVFQGTTFWKPGSTRNGLLVQVTGRASYEWLMRVEIVDPGFTFRIGGEVSWRLPRDPIIAGPFVSTGSFVG